MTLKFLDRFKKSRRDTGGGVPTAEPVPAGPVPVGDHAADLRLEEDETLVRRAQRGQREAFDVLVERYKSRLYGVVYHMLGNHEDANDMVQDSFLNAYRNLTRFKNQSSFYTWIYRVAVNRTINFMRRNRRRTEYSLDDFDAAIQTDPDFVEMMSHATPSREVGLTELQEQLNAALQKLSDTHRAVVVMHDIQGMTHADIARAMKCSEGTVRSRLFYARQQLQALLSDYL
jgi:RNA polymerase sigma-70 factor (ECF subfamily)